MASYLTLIKQDAPQREHSLREAFHALRWLARAGAPWQLLPHDFPPWSGVLPAVSTLERGRLF